MRDEEGKHKITVEQGTFIRLTHISWAVLVPSLPVVWEGLQGHRGHYFQRLPGQVFLDQLLGSFGQRAQRVLQTHTND